MTNAPPTLEVGILHFRAGTMNLSENTLAEAELVVTSEINQRGGIVLKDHVYKVETIERMADLTQKHLPKKPSNSLTVTRLRLLLEAGSPPAARQ